LTIMAEDERVEHYTAILGERILDTPQHDGLGTDPLMLDMLRWDGALHPSGLGGVERAVGYLAVSPAARAAR
jgi:predicted metal-dependent hydrolase